MSNYSPYTLLCILGEAMGTIIIMLERERESERERRRERKREKEGGRERDKKSVTSKEKVKTIYSSHNLFLGPQCEKERSDN